MLSGDEFKAKKYVEGNIKNKGWDLEAKMSNIPIYELNIISGMDWMSKYCVLINYWKNKIQIKGTGGQEIVVFKSGREIPLISIIKAIRTIQKGYIAYLASMIEEKENSSKYASSLRIT